VCSSSGFANSTKRRFTGSFGVSKGGRTDRNPEDAADARWRCVRSECVAMMSSHQNNHSDCSGRTAPYIFKNALAERTIRKIVVQFRTCAANSAGPRSKAVAGCYFGPERAVSHSWSDLAGKRPRCALPADWTLPIEDTRRADFEFCRVMLVGKGSETTFFAQTRNSSRNFRHRPIGVGISPRCFARAIAKRAESICRMWRLRTSNG